MSAELRANGKGVRLGAYLGYLIGGEMDKITVKEIEKPIRVAEDEDIVDIIAENTIDKLVDRLGFTRRLFNRSAGDTRKAVKRLFEKIKPSLPP